MWSAAISSEHCNAQFRQELGAWVFINTETGQYEFTTPYITGPQVGPDETGSVRMPLPHDEPNRFVVASFHTHTPTTYRTDGRVVGVSAGDEDAGETIRMPVIVYDYIATEKDFLGNELIPAGHPLNASAQAYTSPYYQKREN